MAPWFMDSKIVLRFMNMQWRCDILLLSSKTAKVLYMYIVYEYAMMPWFMDMRPMTMAYAMAPWFIDLKKLLMFKNMQIAL